MMKLFRLLLISVLFTALSFSALPGAEAASRQTVYYASTVDGDTLKVTTTSGKLLTLRLLLIDTPESVKPNTPVQPYSKEAKTYLTKLAKSGKLSIQYDTGGKTDYYGRHLVYLYSGSTMINEKLVYNGYARVGYIYSQRKYLATLNKAQTHAQQAKLRIWKTPGYVNPYGEGFVVKKAATSKKPTSVKLKSAPTYLKNCTEVRKYYPYGITSKHPSYRPAFDRDKDKVGCEQN